MDDFPSITAIILAGGQSSRMGRDKAFLPFRGVPLLQRVCHLARECTPIVYVVTARGEGYELIVPKDCSILRETLPTRGPLIAFSLALTQIETDWGLLLACDLPFLTVDTIREWSKLLPTIPEDTIALVPYHNHRWHPLCGFYRRRCLQELQPFIDRGGKSFQTWLNTSPIQVLAIENPQVLFNCNTPEDLEVIIAHNPDEHFVY
jgi:molybdopterin-guanine dinucleotide biosynthesis protein A